MMGWFLFLLILLSFFRVLFIIYNDFFVSLKNWIWGGVGGARFINHCFMKASSPYKKKAYWLPIIWANSYRLATFQPCSGFSRKFRMFVLKLSTFQGTAAHITPIKSYIRYISKSARLFYSIPYLVKFTPPNSSIMSYSASHISFQNLLRSIK